MFISLLGVSLSLGCPAAPEPDEDLTADGDTDADPDVGDPEAVCEAADAGAEAFFTLDLGQFPPDTDVGRSLGIACVVDSIEAADDGLATSLSCTPPEGEDAAVPAVLTVPVPADVTPAWSVGDEVSLSYDIVLSDFIEMHDITAALHTPQGDLLFAGVGDLIAIDALGGEYRGIPNDHPVAEVLAPLSLELDTEICGDPADEFADEPIEVGYAIPGDSTALLGNVVGSLAASGRTYTILQENARLMANNHTAWGLQLVVFATR